MNAATHVTGAIAAAALYTFVTNEPNSFFQGAVFVASTAFGGLIPDICHPSSWVGRRTKPISTAVAKIFGHRSITHSLLFLFIIGILTDMIAGTYGSLIQTGMLIGAASHIILDMMTIQGVHLLYPLKSRVRLPLHTKTGSLLGESFVHSICAGWLIYFSLHWLI
ncbi:inner membrane protein [Salsuginibacillus halophilus]|uniref:Inner membrane protein n=1 Tax=Salsuginibacillus halophilus TaxID=517424 RepID=A0A2P8HWQ2_9BACI|nr:metal-dependent hydrolase [Salsuginibacillus halophilus]PSL50628.1 inner membrane protein [Salsuginibacillus halophilus]